MRPTPALARIRRRIGLAWVALAMSLSVWAVGSAASWPVPPAAAECVEGGAATMRAAGVVRGPAPQDVRDCAALRP